MNSLQPSIAEGDGLGASAPLKMPSTMPGAVLLLNGNERHLEIHYFDGPDRSRRWLLPREMAEDLARWWAEQGCTQAPRGGVLPMQSFGRILVSLLSDSQIYCRGSKMLGGPNATGYQFPRAVLEALATHARRPE